MSEILAVNYDWIRPDGESAGLRYGSLLRILEGQHVVDLHMTLIDTVSLALIPRVEAIRKYYKGKILPDGWRAAEVALHTRPYGLCWIAYHFQGTRITHLVRRILPWAPVVIDSVDVHFLREEAAAALGLMDIDAVAKNKVAEIAAYQEADAVIVVTKDDAQALRAVGITTPIHVIPNIVQKRSRPEIAREREVLFVGGFLHQPNVDGIMWFVRECWPTVRFQVPEAKLTVVGSYPTNEVLALNEVPGVEVAGYVPETGPYLDRAAVSVAPLRFGGGLKGKVCEAMAAGVPLVSTTAGVQGFDAQDGDGVRIQDSREGFADAVVWALTHVEAAEQMGAKGRDLIGNLCSNETVSIQTLDLIRSLVKEPQALNRAAWMVRSLLFHALTSIRSIVEKFGVLSVYQMYRRQRTTKGSSGI